MVNSMLIHGETYLYRLNGGVRVVCDVLTGQVRRHLFGQSGYHGDWSQDYHKV